MTRHPTLLLALLLPTACHPQHADGAADGDDIVTVRSRTQCENLEAGTPCQMAVDSLQTQVSGLATVATSGKYSDLLGAPHVTAQPSGTRVDGPLQLASDASATVCSTDLAGAVRWNGDTFEGCDGRSWARLCSQSEAVTLPCASLAVDGSTTTLDISAEPLDFAANQSFTVEAWVQAQNTTLVTLPIVTHWNSEIPNPGGIVLELRQDPYRWRFNAGFSQLEYAGPEIRNDQRWHHAAGVRDAVNHQLRLYIDGVQVKSGSDGNDDITNSGTWNIGHQNFNAGLEITRWRGNLAYVRVSNVARYASNFAPKKTLGNDIGTAALWPLAKTAGTAVDDAGPANYAGQIAGTVMWSPTCPQ